jgi:hypothetical protein
MTNYELQRELDELMTKMRETKKQNSVQSDWPKFERKYKYRKSTIITAKDVCSL